MLSSRRRPWAGVAALASLLALAGRAAEARHCVFGSNLVPNCDFAVDLSEWDFTGDSELHVSTDGHFAPGCAAVDRHDGVGSMEAFTACLDVEPSTDYVVGGSARVASGAVPTACLLSVIHYSDADCSVYVAEPFNDIPVSASWAEFSRIHGMGATTESAKVRFVCTHASVDFVMRLDDFWFANVIFDDGFEGGDTDAWSVTVP